MSCILKEWACFRYGGIASNLSDVFNCGCGDFVLILFSELIFCTHVANGMNRQMCFYFPLKEPCVFDLCLCVRVRACVARLCLCVGCWG